MAGESFQGSGGYEVPIERIELPFTDGDIEKIIEDPGVETGFEETYPVIWLRGAIAFSTDRGASEVTDRELAARYVGGGFAEWDPMVADAVRQHLESSGIKVTF